MKLAANTQHPDYHPAGMYAEVFLNGERQKGVTHVDDEAGTVTRFLRDAQNRLIVRGQFAETETLHGAVTIEFGAQGLELLKQFPPPFKFDA